MKSIDILKGHLKKVDTNNIISLISDIIFSDIGDVTDFTPNNVYNMDQFVYMFDTDTNKHIIYKCKYNGTTGAFNNSNWDIVNTSLIDNKLSRLVSYNYAVPTETDGQTIFTIPLPTYDKDMDTIIVYKNTTFITSDKYTLTSATRSPSVNGFIRFTDSTLISGILADSTTIAMIILKNIPVGIDIDTSESDIDAGMFGDVNDEQTIDGGTF